MAQRVTHIYFGAASLLTALGDREATLEGMAAARTGLQPSNEWGMPVGQIDPAHPDAQPVAGLTLFESRLVRQIERVCSANSVDLGAEDSQLILSTTKGNIDLLAQHTEELDERLFLDRTAERVQHYLGAARRPILISNACISGLSALVVARRLLLAGDCRTAVVAGGDLLTEFVATGFTSFKSISAAPCRPYDAERDGLTLGEAFGAVVLTTEREAVSAPRYCLEGGAVTNDANHISGPSRTGDGLAYAMERAMREANVVAEEVGMVNTHGTATLYNDEMESKALTLAHLEGVPMNSLKGYIGHTLGAAGLVETILCLGQLEREEIFATQGFTTLGVPCAVNIAAEKRPLTQKRCLKSASGFGGCNAAVVVAAEELVKAPAEPSRREAAVTATAGYTLPHEAIPFAELIRREFRALGDKNLKFYKMSDLAKAAYVASEYLLQGRDITTKYHPTEVAVVLANSVASLEADRAHQLIVDSRPEEGTSPAVFVYTLPNVATGEICIRHKIQGDNTFFIEEGSAFAERYARLLLERGDAKAVIVGRLEKLDERWDVTLKLLEIN